MEEERIDGVMIRYVCQICGEHRGIILSRCSKAYPVAICHECAKKIKEWKEDK